MTCCPHCGAPADWATSNLPIEHLELRTARARNVLKRARINTVGHLLQLTPDDLLDIRKFGVTSLTDVVMALEQLGLELPRESATATPSTHFPT